jgi:hypothetical protein
MGGSQSYQPERTGTSALPIDPRFTTKEPRRVCRPFQVASGLVDDDHPVRDQPARREWIEPVTARPQSPSARRHERLNKASSYLCTENLDSSADTNTAITSVTAFTAVHHAPEGQRRQALRTQRENRLWRQAKSATDFRRYLDVGNPQLGIAPRPLICVGPGQRGPNRSGTSES